MSHSGFVKVYQIKSLSGDIQGQLQMFLKHLPQTPAQRLPLANTRTTAPRWRDIFRALPAVTFPGRR